MTFLRKIRWIVFASLLLVSCEKAKKSTSISSSADFTSLPEYDKKLFRETNCKKITIFGGCASTCNSSEACICEGDFLRCSCSCLPLKNSENAEKEDALMSVDETQYENWKKLSAIFKDLNTAKAKKANEILLTMVNNLLNDEVKAYNQNAQKLNTILKELEENEKKTIREFLEKTNTNVNF